MKGRYGILLSWGQKNRKDGGYEVIPKSYYSSYFPRDKHVKFGGRTFSNILRSCSLNSIHGSNAGVVKAYRTVVQDNSGLRSDGLCLSLRPQGIKEESRRMYTCKIPRRKSFQRKGI